MAISRSAWELAWPVTHKAFEPRITFCRAKPFFENSPRTTGGGALRWDSRSFKQDDIILHLNVGWLKDEATGDHKSTWGLGSELKLSSRLLGIVEAFGDNAASPYVQTGFRYAIRPDLFQVDMTVGKQQHGNSDSRWVSFGIRYTP